MLENVCNLTFLTVLISTYCNLNSLQRAFIDEEKYVLTLAYYIL